MKATPIGITAALFATTLGVAACGAGNTTSKVHGASECKANYAVQGNMVKVRVNEHGPATVTAIVTGHDGQRSGSTKQIAPGTAVTAFSIKSNPPPKRVEVKISETSGTTSCIGSPGSF
ncbi:MAG: hypothetical protein ACREN7_06385 [Candidatus Dormibacteria bacterium]